MKITKKITSIVLALLLAVSAVTGLAISASAALPTSNVTLKIHKYQMNESTDTLTNIGNSNTVKPGATPTIPTGATALKGVTFTAYKIGGLDTAVPTTDPGSYDVSGLTGFEATTDDSGVAEIEVSPSEFGLYLVKETDAPAAVTTSSKAFYVYLPSTDSTDNSTWLTTVDVYPKNLITLGAATLTKTFGGKTVTEKNIEFAAGCAPCFDLYEDIADGDDVKIASVSLTDVSQTGDQTIYLQTSDTRYTNVDGSDTAVTVTEKAGVIAVNNLPKGKYYFVETSGAELADGTKYGLNSTKVSFEIKAGNNGVASTTASANTGTVKTVTLENSSTPTITKAVEGGTTETLDGKATQTFQTDEEITYTITATVPDDIASYKKYEVSDTVVSALAVYDQTITVKQGDNDITDKFWKSSQTSGFYAFTLKAKTNDDGVIGDALTPGVDLKITFTVVINRHFAPKYVNTAIPNTAKVAWTNGSDQSGSMDSNTVYVGTLGLQVVKTSASDNSRLSGAEFNLYDADNNLIKFELKDGGEYAVSTRSGASETLTSGDDGVIKIVGLEKAAYTLKETKAPNGYQLLTSDITINVTKDTYDEITDVTAENLRVIKNIEQPDLPLTGGMGTILFTIAGLALIGGGAFFFIRSRKSKKEDA